MRGALAWVNLGGKTLHLDGLSVLDARTAKAIAKWRGQVLALDGLTRLDAATAESLISWNERDRTLEHETERRVRARAANPPVAEPIEDAPPVHVSVEQQIDNAHARLYDRNLSLRGLTTVDRSVATVLKKWNGPSKVPTARSPPETYVGAEPDREEGCDLAAVTTLAIKALIVVALNENTFESDADALLPFLSWDPLEPADLLPEALSREDGAILKAIMHANEPAPLELTGFESIDAATLSAVAIGNDEIALDGIVSLDVETAAAIAKSSGFALHLGALTTLTPASAKQLAKWEGSELYLNKLATLDAATARALAAWKGAKLELDGLTQLSAAAASALAMWPGRKLELDGLRSLPPRAARALTRWKGAKLELDGIVKLDTKTAEALALWPGEHIELDGLRVVEAGVVSALIKATAEITSEGNDIALEPTVLDPEIAAVAGLRRGTIAVIDTHELRTVGSTLGGSKGKGAGPAKRGRGSRPAVGREAQHERRDRAGDVARKRAPARCGRAGRRHGESTRPMEGFEPQALWSSKARAADCSSATRMEWRHPRTGFLSHARPRGGAPDP